MLSLRRLVAVVAIFTSLVVTTAAFASVHGHGTARNCDVCKTAHLPATQALAVTTIGGPGPLVCVIAASESNDIQDRIQAVSDSRAPPA